MGKANIGNEDKRQYYPKNSANHLFLRSLRGPLLHSYERLFHEQAGEGVLLFVRNLSYVGFGTILSTIFTTLYNIIAGRVLGPSEYGTFSLIQSIAMFLYIPMLLGLNTAMMKYCAESTDQHQQRKIISTTFNVSICMSIISLTVYGIFSHQLAEMLSVSQEILTLSIIFSMLFVFNVLAISSLRGLHLMKDYAIIQPFFGFTLLSVLLILIFFQINSYKAMVFAYYIAYTAVGLLITFRFLRKYLTFNIESSWFSTLWKYSSLAAVGGLSFTIYSNIDRIMINYFMSVESVGIYGVYYYASFAVLTLLSGIFSTVFFPMASKTNDRKSLYKKINTIAPFILIMGLPVSLMGEYVILLLFGEGYPIQFSLMLIFAVAAVFVTLYGIYAWFFNSEGIAGSKLTVSGTLFIAVTNVILNILLIPYIGLHGAIGATALAFAFGLCYNLYYGKKFFQ